MTDKYAVIGNPIAQSKSPQIHKMFAEQTGQADKLEYKAFEAPNGFVAKIVQLRNEGYKGCNVTIPFKFEAFELATKRSERAELAKAVNTLQFDGDTIFGDNTDGVGFVRDIEQNIRFNLNNKHVLLIGAGGAAYGVAWPLLQAISRPLLEAGARLTLINRTEGKAELLKSQLVTPRLSTDNQMLVVVGYKDKSPVDLIIDATSSGLSNEMPILPDIVFATDALAYDLMYGRETPFMRYAREQGITEDRIKDGLGMLVEQAAESFRIWRGCDVKLDTASVIKALRAQQ